MLEIFHGQKLEELLREMVEPLSLEVLEISMWCSGSWTWQCYMMIGLDNLLGLLQPKYFCNSLTMNFHHQVNSGVWFLQQSPVMALGSSKNFPSHTARCLLLNYLKSAHYLDLECCGTMLVFLDLPSTSCLLSYFPKNGGVQCIHKEELSTAC